MHIIYGRKITHSKVILCVWHVRRAWVKNMNRLVPNPDRAKLMLKELGDIMKYCSNDDVTYAIEGFSNKYVDEKKFLDYFQTNWVSGDKICKCAYSCLYLSFFSHKDGIYALN